eukprot:6183135-Pleurochrysis_carterae.AAC.2
MDFRAVIHSAVDAGMKQVCDCAGRTIVHVQGVDWDRCPYFILHRAAFASAWTGVGSAASFSRLDLQ